MPRTTALDAFHWHEALDRAFIASTIFDEFVLDHPAVQRTPSLRKTAARLSDELGTFYQAVARAEPALVKLATEHKQAKAPRRGKRRTR